MSSARYIGIDVGTGSARAGIFDADGRMHAAATHPIQIWRPAPDFVEQSADDIWQAVCSATRQALRDSETDPAKVRGIGFDATCSLVAVDATGRPVSVSPSGADAQNVIVWMDHRALEQTARINADGHEVLRYVGGALSPEMETPKLLWLKENLPECWSRAAHFFDLPDYLTWRATNDATRSLCTTVCKWTYLGHEQSDDPQRVGRWDADYFRAVGLGDLVDEGWRRIGTRVRPMGAPLGDGLCEQAAVDLGLATGTAVGVAIIDAHAGGLGVIGAALDGHAPTPDAMEQRIALIGGTSSCHMAVARGPRYIPGVWGPYYSAMIPDLWLTEGGQSATGALIDHVINSHARAADLNREAAHADRTIYDLLNERLAKLGHSADRPGTLTRDLHVFPDFHGNRSPRADATLRGMVSGLTLGDTVDDLARLYLATLEAVAHGTRHIIDTLNQNGYRIDTIFACGGGTKNPLFLRAHADITGCRIVLPREPEAVLLGSAILGGVASGDFESVLSAMAAMNAAGETVHPIDDATRTYHDAKHAVFQRMYEDQMAYRTMMDA